MNVVLRTRSPGFIRPCAPTNLGNAPRGVRWVHEIKFDGYRLLASKDRDDVRLYTRLQNERGGMFTRVAEAIRHLPITSATIDGECVVERENGHSDFYALKSKAGAARAVMMAFDLLELDGVDLRREPIEVRRSRLSQLCGGNGLIYSIGVEGDGPEVFKQACALGLEGIVSKARGTTYKSGRFYEWVKTLNPVYRRIS